VVVERRGEDKAVVGRQLRAAVVVKEVGGGQVVGWYGSGRMFCIPGWLVSL
jgi:hypothetical protein